ncbi:hypothetical protein Y032_0094g2730 [Ancylostoma ceylanicum]|uniref:Uncharacterized protein n=1 Tax=Ancylostoma ceylanicum TaxID=53326 RepID=A0A016TL24_9BILA|nr:hypothetical protein Y032_0094g2730 [Ancylostoma ceylanicum]
MDGGSPPLDPVQGQANDVAVDDLNLPTPPRCSPISRPSSLMGLPALQSYRPEVTKKTALIAKPSVVSREKSVAMMRFKRSKTRRFFHPYAKRWFGCFFEKRWIVDFAPRNSRLHVYWVVIAALLRVHIIRYRSELLNR